MNCPNIFDKCFYSTKGVIRDVYQLIVLSLKIPEKGTNYTILTVQNYEEIKDGKIKIKRA